MPFFRPSFTINNGDIASASYLTTMVEVSSFASSAMVIIGNSSSATNTALVEIPLSSNLQFNGSGQLDLATNINTAGLVTSLHQAGNGLTPTFTLSGGAGTSGSCTVKGSDMSGSVSITTGTAPSASLTVVAIDFTNAYATAPASVILYPANQPAAALNGTQQVCVGNAQTTFFQILAGTAALATGATYQWYYRVN